jgi:hypothetical protein
MNRLLGRGDAVEVQAFQRLTPSIFTDSLGDTLDQLVSVGLRPVGLTLSLLGVDRIHRDFFTHFYPSLFKYLQTAEVSETSAVFKRPRNFCFLADLQNRTIIFENHYTSLRTRVLK